MRLPEYFQRQLPNAICIAAITTSYGASQTLLSPLLHDRGNDPATIGRLVAVASFVSLLLASRPDFCTAGSAPERSWSWLC